MSVTTPPFEFVLRVTVTEVDVGVETVLELLLDGVDDELVLCEDDDEDELDELELLVDVLVLVLLEVVVVVVLVVVDDAVVVVVS